MAVAPERPVRLLASVLLLGAVILVGAVILHLLSDGQWSFTDALYLSENAASTTGFRELDGMENVRFSRVATGLLVIAGLGATAYFQSNLTAFLVRGVFVERWRSRRMKSQIEQLSDHVVIAGAGSTGMHAIEEVFATKTPFVVIDTNPERLEHLSQELCKGRMLYVVGDATEDSVLLGAGVTRAAAVIAALTEDKENLFVTLSARSLNPSARIVAKVIASDAVAKMMRAGANSTVSPNIIGGRRMASEVVRPTVVQFVDQMLHDKREDLQLEEVRVPQGSMLVGRSLYAAPIRSETNLLVVALRVADKFLYNPDPSTVIDVGTVLVVIGPSENVERLRALVKRTR
ncbi:MAG: TrkA family potassium uptake protein [Polyangiaceae bacterium]